MGTGTVRRGSVVRCGEMGTVKRDRPAHPIAVLLVTACLAVACVGPPGPGGPRPPTTSTTTTTTPPHARPVPAELRGPAAHPQRQPRWPDRPLLGREVVDTARRPASRRQVHGQSRCLRTGGPDRTYGIEQIVDGALVAQDCSTTTRLAEGPHEWKVRLAGHGEVSRSINVVHHLLVGLGDSYGSGRRRRRHLRNRSGMAGQELPPRRQRRPGPRPASAIEHADDQSAVTFLPPGLLGHDHRRGTPWARTPSHPEDRLSPPR